MTHKRATPLYFFDLSSLSVSPQSLLKPPYITTLSGQNYNGPWLGFHCICIYISGPFNSRAVCESRFSCGLHYGSITVSTFAIKMPFFFFFFLLHFFGSASLYSAVTSKGRERERERRDGENGAKKEKKKERWRDRWRELEGRGGLR